MISSIASDWSMHLADEFQKPYFNRLDSAVMHAYLAFPTHVFPKKNGDRFHTTFAADVIPGILKKEDKCILTLLKGKTYSLSIKLKVNSNTVNSFKDSFDNIYIYIYI